MENAFKNWSLEDYLHYKLSKIKPNKIMISGGFIRSSGDYVNPELLKVIKEFKQKSRKVEVHKR